MFIEILFKILLFKGGVLIYGEHCTYNKIYINEYLKRDIVVYLKFDVKFT